MKLRAGRVVECCGQNLMMNSYARLELRNAERNTDSVGPVHEVSEKKKKSRSSVGTWDRGYLCDTLQNLAGLCPCLEILHEAEFKNYGLISLVEGIPDSA